MYASRSDSTPNLPITIMRLATVAANAGPCPCRLRDPIASATTVVSKQIAVIQNSTAAVRRKPRPNADTSAAYAGRTEDYVWDGWQPIESRGNFCQTHARD